MSRQRVVLLVEDSPIAQELTRVALEEAGFRVRTATGLQDLELQISSTPGYLDDLDLMVLDMELQENLLRQRRDKSGTHRGVYMTGSQIAASMMMSYPQLNSVPFILYSGKEMDEIKGHLDELREFTELDEQIRNNYKGFVSKDESAELVLVEMIKKVLHDQPT